MIDLILDTSSDVCLIALIEDNRVLAQEITCHSNHLSKILLPTIESVLQKNNLAPPDLTGISVGIGPGSYTGTRLGVAVGKSLSFGLNVPIRAFNSLLCFIPAREGAFAHIMPARSGAFFLLTGFISNIILRQDSACLVPPEELIPLTKDVDFLISASPENLPEVLKQKLLLPPTPNLESLCQYLATLDPIPEEEVELLYLHTPS